MTARSRDGSGSPFSHWLRGLSFPLDSRVISNQNLDYCWHNYRESWLLTIEEKRHGAYPPAAQLDTHHILEQMLATASGETYATLRGPRIVHYRGHYLVRFEKTTPDDSAWVGINGTTYDNPREAVLSLLRDGRQPRVSAAA